MKQFPLKTLWKNEDGVAALEFALILPLLAIMYFGTIEISLLVEANRRVTSTTSSIADLVARTSEVNYCEIEDVFFASSRIIREKDPTKVKMRITSIVEDPKSGKPTVEWSQGRGGQSAHAEGTNVTVETGIMPSAGSVIFAEVEYSYDTPFQHIVPSTSKLKKQFYLRPRQSKKVTWVGSTSNPGNC